MSRFIPSSGDFFGVNFSGDRSYIEAVFVCVARDDYRVVAQNALIGYSSPKIFHINDPKLARFEPVSPSVLKAVGIKVEAEEVKEVEKEQ